ncbi:MAG: SCO family protein [Pseudomonadales bacterium]|jgi:protein SCO1/2
MTGLQKTVVLCLAFVAIVVGLFVYNVTRTPVLSEAALRDKGVYILPRPREITDFDLTTHTGEPFTLEDLKGHWTFAFFGFTNCPDVCPTAMATLGQARRMLGDGDAFQGVLVTVDPERDDAESLRAYVTTFSPDFIGVRGSHDEIAKFAEQVNVAFGKVPERDENGDPIPGQYTVDHTANIVIINPMGHYHGFIKYPQQADTIVAAFRSLSADF